MKEQKQTQRCLDFCPAYLKLPFSFKRSTLGCSNQVNNTSLMEIICPEEDVPCDDAKVALVCDLSPTSNDYVPMCVQLLQYHKAELG